MTAANDNFEHQGLYEALDALTRTLNVQLMQGKLWSMYFDAAQHARDLGYEHAVLLGHMKDYQSRPEDDAARSKNQEIHGKITQILEGDAAEAHGYIIAAKVAEQANKLAEFIALGHDVGTAERRSDEEKNLRGALVDSLVNDGGIGRNQATEKVRSYARAVHKMAAQFVGTGI